MSQPPKPQPCQLSSWPAAGKGSPHLPSTSQHCRKLAEQEIQALTRFTTEAESGSRRSTSGRIFQPWQTSGEHCPASADQKEKCSHTVAHCTSIYKHRQKLLPFFSTGKAG